jgi:hypothetical protein
MDGYRRRWMRPVSQFKPKGGESLGVVIDISFDEGATWLRLRDRPGVASDCYAIRFNQTDLREILAEQAADAGIDNLYGAYMEGKLRVRATFNIDLDERVVGRAQSDTSPLAAEEATKIVFRDDDFHEEDTFYHDTVDPLGWVPEGPPAPGEEELFSPGF